MENASKALIIAGAILLAILIISLGIFIFNQASEVTKSSNLSEVEVLQFNEKFTSFEGTNIKGSEVNSLITRIIQNNVSNQDDTSKQVKLTVEANNWQTGQKPNNLAITNSIAKAQTGRTYTVKCKINDKTGLVESITISDS